MIDSLSNFHFIRPAWLLALPVVVGVWWLWRRAAEPLSGWREQVDAELLQAMTTRGTQRRDFVPYLLLAGWMIAVVAIAGPTWKREPNPFAADATPLIILLKADATMDRPGVSPSPLERARLKIADLAEARKGQPLGLIVYSGSAHLVLPPTRDTKVVAEMAAEVSSGIMPKPGDRLDLAIRKAGDLLSRDNTGGTLLVIADSVEGDPQAAAEAHRESGGFPIQILALSDDESLVAAAKPLGASIETVTPDDGDINAVVKAAERKGVVGMAGDAQRWQEAGYRLVPLLVLIVAASFRRERQTTAEESS